MLKKPIDIIHQTKRPCLAIRNGIGALWIERGEHSAGNRRHLPTDSKSHMISVGCLVENDELLCVDVGETPLLMVEAVVDVGRACFICAIGGPASFICTIGVTKRFRVNPQHQQIHATRRTAKG
jgi:hypothetical protein